MANCGGGSGYTGGDVLAAVDIGSLETKTKRLAADFVVVNGTTGAGWIKTHAGHFGLRLLVNWCV
jgi:hypothetical protein